MADFLIPKELLLSAPVNRLGIGDWGLAMAELAADGRRVSLGVGMNVVVCRQIAGWSWCRANLRWSQKFGFLGNYQWISKVWLMRAINVSRFAKP